MATTWSHNGWRREDGYAAQRAKLILHIEEVENRLADWQTQSAQGQSGARFQLEQYLSKLESKLRELDAALGLTPENADHASFVQVTPI